MNPVTALHRNRRIIFGLLVVTGVWLRLPQIASAGDEPQERKHFLWQIDSPTTRAYLLGSIHMLRQDVYPLASVIEEAFATSDVLVLEADVFAAPQEALAQSIMAYAEYPSGQTLKSELPEQDYLDLLGFLLEAGIPGDSVQQYRPWYVLSMVEQTLMSRLGLRPEYGIDAYFRLKASGQKQIQELESIEAQLQLLADFSDQEQLLMMSWTLEDLEHAAEDFEQLLQIWKRGDLQAMDEELQKEFREDPRFEPIWNVMVEQRNRAMADRIAAFLETQQRHFIIVGAGHLVGPRGLVALLRERGYAVRQL